MFFNYGDKEINYLSKKDKRMADVIHKVGKIEREVDSDIFSSVIHQIIGQQISTKAQQTVWRRMEEGLEKIDADTILSAGEEKLCSFGISRRKAEYITDLSKKVENNSFDIDRIKSLSDEDAIKELSSLNGIGVWTAEMILLFCLERPNIFSYGDFGIQKGLRMIYRHREIDKKLFEKYRKRFSPCCSVASLYLWAVAGGALPELKDPLIYKKI